MIYSSRHRQWEAYGRERERKSHLLSQFGVMVCVGGHMCELIVCVCVCVCALTRVHVRVHVCVSV